MMNLKPSPGYSARTCFVKYEKRLAVEEQRNNGANQPKKKERKKDRQKRKTKSMSPELTEALKCNVRPVSIDTR